MRLEFKERIEAYKKGAKDDRVGLYEIIGFIEGKFHTKNQKTVMDLTLEFVKDMLSKGFHAGKLERSLAGYRAWENQNASYVLNRIETEWQKLGRNPNIGDIVYFDFP